MQDSSVVFNLQEIMKLEHERVAAEQAAARAAIASAAEQRAAREREAREQKERQARELEEQALAQAARERAAQLELESERNAALLRVKLQAEASERLQRERIELEHAEKLRALEVDRGRQRVARTLLASTGLVAVLATSSWFFVLAPSLRATQARQAELEQQTVEGAKQTQALRRALDALGARQAADAFAEAVTQRDEAPAQVVKPAQPRIKSASARDRGVQRVTQAPTREHDALEALEHDGDDPLDPIGGLIESDTGKDARRKRSSSRAR